MRKIVILFSCLFIALACAAQPKLRYGSIGPWFEPDSVRMGDSFTIYYNIVNEDTIPFLDSIYSYITSNKALKDSLRCKKAFSEVIPAGDSVLIFAQFDVTDTIFNSGETAIVVVWPTGGGTENVMNRRMINKPLYVDYPVSVWPPGGNFNRVRIYPNPLRQALTFKTNGLLITELGIADIQGRVLTRPELRNGQADLGYLDPGVYILTVRFQDGGISTFRIIKQ